MTLTDEDRALIDRVVKPYTALHALVVNYPEEVAALLSAARQALSPNNPAGQAMEGDHG